MTSIRLSVPAERTRGRARFAHRALRRITRDPHAILGIGLVVTILTIAWVGDHDQILTVIAVSLEFLAAQMLAALMAPHLRPSSAQRQLIGGTRFVLAIVYISVAT